MCGIFGRFDPSGISPDNVEQFIYATNLLRHRGPDEAGYWEEGPFFLGHCRLSIIDLRNARQPMATEDGALVITFNGEIYNYLELRDELIGLGHSFKTRSDTEVILMGYRQWGPDVTKRLVGMFAFALADRKEKSLFLARDRFGEKPLFYCESSTGDVSFASELRALAALPDINRQVDPEGLALFLCLNYVPNNLTLLKDVKKLEPGTWRLYRIEHQPRIARYWSLHATDQRLNIGLNDALEELRKRLDRAVEIALRSDVPVALFLSGGIDSSIVAESAVRQGVISKAFCLDFDEPSYSEWGSAQFVAERLDLPLQRVVLTPSALEDFLSVVAHADDPLADSSALAVWALAKEVGRAFKVIISGDGGDELFGGYLTYKATAFHKLLISPLPERVRKAMTTIADWIPSSESKVSAMYKLMRFLRAANLPCAQAHFSWNGSWLPQGAAAILCDGPVKRFAKNSLCQMAIWHQLTDLPTLKELQFADINDYLPNDILTKVDRMTMAHGLEARAPLLNPEVAEFAMSLPNHLKLSTFGKPKRLLRELATRIYGRRIGAAKKKGFSIPVHHWLRGPGRERLEGLLSPTNIQSTGFFDVGQVLKAKNQHLVGQKSLGFELWGMMVFMAWYQMRISSPPSRTRLELPLIRLRIPL